MGSVTNFWRNVPRTRTAEPTEIVVARPSLDTLADAVESSRNRVVHCQCELHKAEDQYKQAQTAWAEAVIERGIELGISEFCNLRRRPRPEG